MHKTLRYQGRDPVTSKPGERELQVRRPGRGVGLRKHCQSKVRAAKTPGPGEDSSDSPCLGFRCKIKVRVKRKTKAAA